MNPIAALTGITSVSKIVTGAVAVFAWIFGIEAMPFVLAYLGLCALDFLTGWIKAIIGKKVESNAVRVGVGKKTLGFIFIATCNVIDSVVGLPVCLAVLAGSILCRSEAISIMENLNEAGLPVKKVLNILKEKDEDALP